MIQKIKTILYTLMFVFIVTFIGTIYYTYNNSVAQEQEKFDILSHKHMNYIPKRPTTPT